jgi:hypothetical protein
MRVRNEPRLCTVLELARASIDRLGSDLLHEAAAFRPEPHDSGLVARLGARAHRTIAATARSLRERCIDRYHALGIGNRESTDQRVIGPRQATRSRGYFYNLRRPVGRHPELGHGGCFSPTTAEIDADEP